MSFRLMNFSGNLMFPNSFTIAGGREKGNNIFNSYSDLYRQRAEIGKTEGGKILLDVHFLF